MKTSSKSVEEGVNHRTLLFTVRIRVTIKATSGDKIVTRMGLYALRESSE